RSLEIGNGDFHLPNLTEDEEATLLEGLITADDERIYVLAELLSRGRTIEAIHDDTKIDCLLLRKFKHVMNLEIEIINQQLELKEIKKAKKHGFSDQQIARMWGTDDTTIYRKRMEANIAPVYKMVDTCAAAFESTAPYFYSTYEEESESVRTDKEKVLVLGSGPIRIGQGIEFDYATVHSVLAIKEMGYEAIIMNNNPETVSTDFSISDKLYFEPLTLEDVMHVVEL